MNLLHFIFFITSINLHFYLHSNGKLLFLQTGFLITNMILENENMFFIF